MLMLFITCGKLLITIIVYDKKIREFNLIK